MQKIINVIFRIDIDTGLKAGTGHLARSLTIKNEIFLNRNKYRCFFLFKDLNQSKKLISKYQKKDLIIYNNNFKEKLKFISKNDIFIFDTPFGIDNRMKKFIENKKCIKTLLIDDVNKPNLNKAIIFNGIKYLKKKLTNKKNKIFQGTKYILLNKIFAKHKSVNLKNEILIGSGGTDKKHNLIKIINVVKKLKDLKFLVIVGEAVDKNNPVNKIKCSNIRLLKKKNNLYKYYLRVKGCILSGGIMMFESLALGKKTFVLETYKHQKKSIDFFEKKKLVIKIGVDNKLYKNKLLMGLNKIQNINTSSKNKYIDGKALLRLKKIINREFLSNV